MHSAGLTKLVSFWVLVIHSLLTSRRNGSSRFHRLRFSQQNRLLGYSTTYGLFEDLQVGERSR